VIETVKHLETYLLQCQLKSEGHSVQNFRNMTQTIHCQLSCVLISEMMCIYGALTV